MIFFFVFAPSSRLPPWNDQKGETKSVTVRNPAITRAHCDIIPLSLESISLSFFGGLTSPRPVQTLQKKINSRGVRIRRGGLKPRRRKRTNTFRPLNGKQILLETLYYESRKTNKEDGGGTGQSPESVTDCAQSPREGTRPPPGYQEEVPRRGLKKWMPPARPVLFSRPSV